MKALCLFLVSQMATLLMSAACWAHGVEGYIERTTGYCITAEYDDGEPMSYAAVEIRSPEGDIAFQTGRTDRNGRFLLYPDRPGQWQVVVQDGMGHRLALDLTAVVESAAPPVESSSVHPERSGRSRVTSIMAGLAFIFGLFGWIYGWQARTAGKAGRYRPATYSGPDISLPVHGSIEENQSED
jgi:nickel transport protein